MAYNNTYALTVPQSLADQYEVSNFSDQKPHKSWIHLRIF
ncbi:hypothetical protein NF868_16920 [Bacillus zhangzhouensis]|nr:hypothetical protein NF868_16920 [Bacillus zhangzhouensis]